MPDRQFVNEMVNAHNYYRKHHGVPALKHSSKISGKAQKWADNLAKSSLFSHSNGSDRKLKGQPMGENIAMKSGGDYYKGEEATDQWYQEISRYNFRTHSGAKTGHFTQVIWKGTKEIGVGRAQGRDGRWVVVTNYHPAGNFVGKHPENVPQPKTGRPAEPSFDKKKQDKAKSDAEKAKRRRNRKNLCCTQ